VGSRRITHRGRWLAAVLAAGDAALLSHVSAAALWRLMTALLGPVHVSVPNRSSWQPRGIIIHRPRKLEPADRTRRFGIPVTSPSRTLIDIAGLVSPTQLRRAFQEVERLELLDRDKLGRLCDRMRGRRGVGRLRRLLSEAPLPASETRSRLEARFLAFCRDRGLPMPATNVPLGEFEVDCLWPEQRVVAEIDSWSHHGDRDAFEQDRIRDAAIQRMAHTIIRITDWRMREPDALEEDLRQLLGLGV
jgi:very-short-patch-repair endonuclease